MDECSIDNQNLYKRLLAYHCYRDGRKIPTKTVTYLCKVYGDDFITTKTVKRLYRKFDGIDFSFDELFQVDFQLPPKPPKTTLSIDSTGLEQFDENCDDDETEDGEGIEKKKPKKGKKGPKRPCFSKTSSGKDGTVGIGQSSTEEVEGEGQNENASSANNVLFGENRNMKRRQLFLHCFEAKYSATEAARYLNSVYGENFCTKTSVCGWYRKFRSKNFTLVDKPRSGRRAAMDDSKLVEYMEINPKAVVPKLCEHFQVHRKTMIRSLGRLGYRFVTDHWVRITDKPEVTDKHLCEFKLANPAATVREIAENFQINRAVVARRLRAMGFNIPKWPTWPKKKKGEAIDGSAHRGPRLNPNETYIKRKHPKKPKVINVQNNNNHNMHHQFEDSSSLMTHSTSDSSSTLTIPGGGHHTGDQMSSVPQAAHQQYNTILQLATSQAVNSILPAVLRHKVQTNNSSSYGLPGMSPLQNLSSTAEALSNALTTLQSNPHNHNHAQPSQVSSQQGNSVIVGPSAISVPTSAPSNSISNMSYQPQQSTNGVPTNGPPQTSSGNYEPDPLMQAFDPYNPPLDNVQVQSILHPYYM